MLETPALAVYMNVSILGKTAAGCNILEYVRIRLQTSDIELQLPRRHH